MFNTLEEDLIESRSGLQKSIDDKNDALESEKAKNDKILELENLKLQRLKRLVELGAEIKPNVESHATEV